MKINYIVISLITCLCLLPSCNNKQEPEQKQEHPKVMQDRLTFRVDSYLLNQPDKQDPATGEWTYKLSKRNAMLDFVLFSTLPSSSKAKGQIQSIGYVDFRNHWDFTTKISAIEDFELNDKVCRIYNTSGTLDMLEGLWDVEHKDWSDTYKLKNHRMNKHGDDSEFIELVLWESYNYMRWEY